MRDVRLSPSVAKRTLLTMAVGLALWAAACADMESAYIDSGMSCTGDADCTSSDLCVLGTCVEPQAVNLDTVDLDVAPFDTSLAPPQQVLSVEPSDDDRLNIVVHPTTDANGRVTDRNDAPIGALVVAIPTTAIAGRSLSVSTSSSPEDGSFTLRLVDGQTYRLVVYPDDDTLAPMFGAQAVLVSGGTFDLGTLALPNEMAQLLVEGRVTAGSGAETLGIPGLQVRFLDGSQHVSSSAITDNDGHFAVRLADAGDNLTLQVRPTEATSSFPTLSVAGYAFTENTLLDDVNLGGALYAPVPFAATVTGPRGQRVPQADVIVFAELGAGVLRREAVTDENGELHLSLPPGPYQFAIIADTDTDDAGMLSSTAADVAQDGDTVSFVLPPRVSFTGEVTTPDNRRLADATVRMVRVGAPLDAEEAVIDGTTWTFSSRTNDTGAFALRLDPGRYRFTVVPPAHSQLPHHTQIIDVYSDDRVENVELPSAGTFFGTLVTPGGSVQSQLVGSRVRAFAPFASEDGRALLLSEAEVDEDGNFVLLLPDLGGDDADEQDD